VPKSCNLKPLAWITCLFAAASIHAVAQADPGQVAFSLEREGRFAEAEQAWGALAKQYPTNPEPLAHLGLIESKQARYGEAIQHYRKAMALNSAMPGLRLNLGLALFKNGDYQQAITDLAPLRTVHPEDQQLTILIGMSQYALGRFSDASKLLNHASIHDPQNLTLLLTLAHSCLWSKQYSCVQDAFHRIVSLNADSAEAEMLMGEALDEMKDHEGAVRQFRAAAKVNPKEPNVHFGLGYLLWTKGQYPEAAVEFQAELANDPKHLKAMLYLGDSRMQMNQADQAQPLLEQVVKADPEDGMAHRDLAIILAERGNKDAAVREFQTAIKINPKDVNAHYRLGRLYRSMSRTADAKRELDQANSLNKEEDQRLLKVMSTIPKTDNSSKRDAQQPQ